MVKAPFHISKKSNGIRYYCFKVVASGQPSILVVFEHNNTAQMIPYSFESIEDRDLAMTEMDADWLDEVYQEYKTSLN